MNLGGDPTQALVHSTTTGNFVVTLSSVDLGQGLKTVAAQIAAETLGVPYENIIVDTADTDTGPHCMGTFACRGTHRIGNAIIMAAQEAREVMLEVAAEELEVDAEDLETDGKGSSSSRAPTRRRSTSSTWRWPRTSSTAARSPAAASSSRSAPTRCPRPARWTRTPARRTPARSPRSRSTTRPAWSRCSRCTTPTRSAARSTRRWRTQQIEGGAWMGISPRALRDDRALLPGPRPRAASTSSEYLMPGPGGHRRDARASIIERPAANGPYGAKGIGEMTANAPIPAIANAIFDACGVRLTEMPFTPERVLRGLDELRAA